MIAFWVVFKLLDPISLETATKQSSSEFFFALTAPFYGRREDEAQRKLLSSRSQTKR
jgi:hypothetical protein